MKEGRMTNIEKLSKIKKEAERVPDLLQGYKCNCFRRCNCAKGHHYKLARWLLKVID